ncbi:MAG TPA: hypothetical protein VN642_02440 [Dongiaceae bacterium]|nr:hypothetical protein [Dongiaceae bacterium]
MIHQHEVAVIAPLVLIGLVHRRIAKNGAFFLVVSNLPITVLHELAHFTAALMLGGKPVGFSLWPTLKNGTWQLGSVTARVTIISAAPTALAPLLWLPVGGLLLVERTALAGESLPILCCIHLAAYMCVAASIPSWQDIKVAIMHPLSLMLWSAILVAADFVIG